MNNRLDRTSLREQDHHDHDQFRWPAQPFHHGAFSCVTGLLTRVTAIALGLIRVHTNVALSDFARYAEHISFGQHCFDASIGFVGVCICHSMPIGACFFKPAFLFRQE